MTDFNRADNEHSLPLGATHPATSRPPIVTRTFTSRLDRTPRTERPQDGGSVKSRHPREFDLTN